MSETPDTTAAEFPTLFDFAAAEPGLTKAWQDAGLFRAQAERTTRLGGDRDPFTVLIPPNNLYNVANVNVPMDDTNTAFYFIAWGHPSQTPETETWRKFLRQTVGVDLDPYYRPLRNEDNRFWQDRQAMKAGNFTGITGFPNQDVAMWVTMGPIADRTNDRLGASDMAAQLAAQLARVVACACDCVAQAGLTRGDLDTVYLTGGSSALRPFQQALQAAFAGVPMVSGDLFGGVASGLAYTRV